MQTRLLGGTVLHDSIEDQARHYPADPNARLSIEEKFGPALISTVLAVDGAPHPARAKNFGQRAPWRAHKEDYFDPDDDTPSRLK